VKEALDELVKKRWPQEGGREMLAGRWLLDSGDGLNTLAVYRYCQRWKGSAVRPVKGEAALGGNVYVLPSKTAGDHGGKLIRANVVALKDFWAALMAREAGTASAVSFPRGTAEDEAFVSHLVSEERRLSRSARGQVSGTWMPRSGAGANHWWDALVYGLAGAADLKVLGAHRGVARAGPRVRGSGGDAFGRK
jgi:phage terminase large subunit GpA-like protein